MMENIAFGQVVKERRQALGLTQAELARRVGCAAVTIRKIEYDALRPSVQVAQLLALALNVPENEHFAFVQLARSERSPSPIPTPHPLPGEIGLEDLTGRAVKGFQLRERIGTGGFGIVYRAVQPSVEREVAVKIILPHYANHPNFIRRFEAEAQLIARLEHPHIVPLYDYWREPGAAYLIMRLLRGSLEDELKDGPLALAHVRKYTQQMGLALDAAHRYGVIHRDIKPANVLLDDDANAYLADFGIAKNLEKVNGSNLSEDGALIGTLAYVSPEQIKAELIQPQTDIYCLGIMLFEMITGQLPFPGPTPVAYLQQHLNDTLPSIRDYNPDLPSELDQVIRRATAKNPAERYPDVPALLADLLQMLPSGNGAAAQPSRTDKAMIVLTTQELAALENPFKGLRAFIEADAANFYGRDTLIQELLTHLSESSDPSFEDSGPGLGQDLIRFLAVVGPSGSGKSSVVKAGLVPALRRGGLPGSENWFIVDFTPGTHPWEEVEAALLRIAANPPESLLGQLQADNRGLLRAVRRILPDDDKTELVMIIDQFEELFTLVEEEAVRAHFLDTLLTAILDERSRLRVVITLRADFTDRPLQYVDFGDLMRQRTTFVLPLTPEEVEQAITRPLQQLGLRVEPELVAAMIHDVSDQPGTLPLLQYALTELFDRRQGQTLTLAAYRESGGVTGALARRADEVYAALDQAGHIVTRQLFLRLVTPGEGGNNGLPSLDTRRRVLRSELATLDAPGANNLQEVLDRVIDTYGRYRLLTFDRDPVTRSPTVEVAHEALLHEWGRLREWLNHSRGDIRLQQQLAQATREWLRAGKDSSYLLRGSRLGQFAGWAAGTQLALAQAEHAFLEASIAARDQRRAEEIARQQRELETALKLAETEKVRAEEQVRSAHQLRQRAFFLAAALVVALVLAATAALFSRQSGRNAVLAASREAEARINAEIAVTRQAEAEAQARLARSRALAGAAVANLKLDPELSVLLALQAVKTTYDVDGTWTKEAEEALHQAVQEASRLQLNFSGRVNPLRPATFSSDGAHLVGLDFDGRSKIWDVVTGQELIAVPGIDAILSRDGQRLITLVENEDDDSLTRKVWNATTGEALASASLPIYIDQDELTAALTFSPEGTRLAAGYQDGTVDIWDFAAAAYQQQLRAHTNRVNGLAFSADGAYLATASSDHSTSIWRLPLSADAPVTTIQPWLTVTDPAGEMLKVTLSPDGKTMATVSDGFTATIWDLDLASGKAAVLSTFSLAVHNGPIAQIAFSPDGFWLASTGGNKVLLWEALSGHLLLTLPGGASKIAFSPDGARLLTVDAKALKIWDLTPTGSKEIQTLAGHSGFVFGVAFSPDGAHLATSGLDGQAVLWDWASGQRLVSLIGHQGPVQDIQFSPDGALLATAGHDSTARLWNAASGRELFTLRGHGQGIFLPFFEGIMELAFSPDGMRLVTAGLDGTGRVWETRTGEQLFILPHDSPVKSIAFSPDGLMLATADSDQTFHGWNASTGEGLFTVSAPAEVLYVAFSPDGQRLAASIRDTSIKIWDVATLLIAGQDTVEVAGDELALLTLTGHTQVVWRLAYSQDGARLASVASTEIKVWDMDTGQELLSLPAGENPYAVSVSFSPDGRYLAAGKEDGTARIHVLPISELVSLARSRLTRGWTLAECIHYHIDPCPSVP